MILREAFLLVVIPLFLFSLWVGVNDKDYDKHYLIKMKNRPSQDLYLDGKHLQRAEIRAHYVEREFWHLQSVQDWAKKLAKIKFPNAEIREFFGVYQIKLDGEWHNIACSADRKYLYVGWELTERQKEKYREKSGYYINDRNKEKGHSSCVQGNPKSL